VSNTGEINEQKLKTGLRSRTQRNRATFKNITKQNTSLTIKINTEPYRSLQLIIWRRFDAERFLEIRRLFILYTCGQIRMLFGQFCLVPFKFGAQ
jgi:hypothetical protein